MKIPEIIKRLIISNQIGHIDIFFNVKTLPLTLITSERNWLPSPIFQDYLNFFLVSKYLGPKILSN